MQKTEFVKQLEQFILPLFTGCEIIGYEESNAREASVALGTGGTILAKYDSESDYRVILKRDMPFKTSDANLVKSILQELQKVDNYGIQEIGHIKSLQIYSMEKAICESICNYSSTSNVLLGLLNELTLWSNKTYEGHRTTFGFLVEDFPVEKKQGERQFNNLHYQAMLSSDFSALLSDGKNSVLNVNAEGYITQHITLPHIGFANTFAPHDYINMAHVCQNGKVGLSLLENGDMLLFCEQQLVFAKRHGIWNSYSHEEIINKIAPKSTDSNLEIRTAIYLSSLDVSFEKTGGCVAYVKSGSLNDVLNHIDEHDIVSEDAYYAKMRMLKEQTIGTPNYDEIKFNRSYEDFIDKSTAIKTLNLRCIIAGRKFNELNRTLREEIIGMDGATIINYDGEIIAAGAIIKIEAGSTGGGRLAAAKTLSRYGNAIKISMDGNIIGVTFDKSKNQYKTIFSA